MFFLNPSIFLQVTVGEKTCQGTGPNKKLARRAAAEAMLAVLGYAKPLPKPGKSVLKQSSVQSNVSDSPEQQQNGESSHVVTETADENINGIMTLVETNLEGSNSSRKVFCFALW